MQKVTISRKFLFFGEFSFLQFVAAARVSRFSKIVPEIIVGPISNRNPIRTGTQFVGPPKVLPDSVNGRCLILDTEKQFIAFCIVVVWSCDSCLRLSVAAHGCPRLPQAAYGWLTVNVQMIFFSPRVSNVLICEPLVMEL